MNFDETVNVELNRVLVRHKENPVKDKIIFSQLELSFLREYIKERLNARRR